MYLAILLTACSVPTRWLVEYQQSAHDLLDVVEEKTTENFSDFDPVEDEEGEWTETAMWEASAGTAYLIIEEATDGRVVVTFWSDALLGTWTDDKLHASHIYEESLEEATAGGDYSFVERETVRTEEVLDLVRDGNTLSGTFVLVDSVLTEWEEPDLWDTSGSTSSSNIPADSYVDGAAENAPDRSDCESDLCLLSVELVQVFEYEVSGTRVRGEDEGSSQAISISGNPFH